MRAASHLDLVVTIAVAACSSPPAPVIAHNAPSLGWRPAPKVARGGTSGLTTLGLPAISADGSQIVVAFREPDGDRGLPNLTLVTKDREDVERERHVVLSVAEADTMLDDADGKNAPLDARVARANQWLHDRHVVQHFDPLLVLEPATTQHPADRTTAARAGFTVTWQRSRLRITDGTTVLVERQTPSSWLPGPSKVGTNVCQRSPYLGAAAIARAYNLAVVTISYTAESDFCLAPPDQHHVITW